MYIEGKSKFAIKTKIFLIILISMLLINTVSVYANDLQKKSTYFKSVEDKINSEGSADVIIVLQSEKEKNNKKSDNKLSVSKSDKDRKMGLLSELDSDFSKKEDFKIINGFSGSIDKSGLRKIENLRNNGQNILIFEDTKLSILDTEQGSEVSTQLITSVGSIRANNSWESFNVSGSGIIVAVIDSGIDYTHPDLGNCTNVGQNCRIIDGYDFFNNDIDPMDDNGHGTHVAGIIGANGQILGVAPNVSFYALKVCDSGGNNCSSSNIISAIEWAVANGSDIISMSLGASYSSNVMGNSGKDAISIAADNAADLGVLVVAAAGNNNQGSSTINVPAAASKVLSVGSIDDSGSGQWNDDVISSFTSKGPMSFGRFAPTISAPGSSIYSTVPNSSCSNCHPSRYLSISGTSMATPHVSGVAALIIEHNTNTNNNLTKQEIKTIITQSARPFNDVFTSGTGVVDAKNSIETRAYVTIYGTNTYNQNISNDRWEFISPINNSVTANVTIHNLYSENIVFNISVENLTSFDIENYYLDSSLFSFNNYISADNGNTSFIINFSSKNSDIVPTTFAGLIKFYGLRNNGSDNVSINLSVPLMVTFPIRNIQSITRTFKNSGASDGDVYTYAYVNNRAGNETIILNWSDWNDDLDLYVYNSSGDIDDYGGYSPSEGVTNETVYSSKQSSIKWIRVHAYDFSSNNLTFELSVNTHNNAPRIINVTKINGSDVLEFYNGTNVSILISYEDTDNDEVFFSTNNPMFTVSQQTPNNITLIMNDSSSVGNFSFTIIALDEFNSNDTENITITIIEEVINSLIISDYNPNNSSISIVKNSTLEFNFSAYDINNLSINSYWFVDDINYLNNSNNFTFYSQNFSVGNHLVRVNITNNITNSTISWNVSVSNPVIEEETPIVRNSRGGGGGGSGGGFSGIINNNNNTVNNINNNETNKKNNSEIFEKEILTNSEYKTLVLNTSESNGALKDFKIILNNDQNNLTIKIKKFNFEILFNNNNENLSELVNKSVPEFTGKKIELLNIDHENLSEDNIKEVVFNFSINKTIISDLNISKTDVRMFRFNDKISNEWMELNTQIIFEDDFTIYYTAKSPGLSVFIIGNSLNNTINNSESNITQSKKLNRKSDSQEFILLNDSTIAENSSTAPNKSIPNKLFFKDFLRNYFLVIIIFIFIIFLVMVLIFPRINKKSKQ